MTLCNLGSNEIADNSVNLPNENSRQHLVLPLRAQVISVPRDYFSPCPERFRYTFNGKEWFGLVVVKKPAPKGVLSKLKIQMSVGFHFSSVSSSPCFVTTATDYDFANNFRETLVT